MSAEAQPQPKRPAGIAGAVDFYRGLSPTKRRALWVAVAFEALLIAFTERDIQRRPATGIRGSKLLWRAIATQNVVGPAAYFAFGRRRAS